MKILFCSTYCMALRIALRPLHSLFCVPFCTSWLAVEDIYGLSASVIHFKRCTIRENYFGLCPCSDLYDINSTSCAVLDGVGKNCWSPTDAFPVHKPNSVPSHFEEISDYGRMYWNMSSVILTITSRHYFHWHRLDKRHWGYWWFLKGCIGTRFSFLITALLSDTLLYCGTPFVVVVDVLEIFVHLALCKDRQQDSPPEGDGYIQFSLRNQAHSLKICWVSIISNMVSSWSRVLLLTSVEMAFRMFLVRVSDKLPPLSCSMGAFASLL